MKKLNPDGSAGRTSIRHGMDIERAVTSLYRQGRGYPRGDGPQLSRGRNANSNYLDSGDGLETAAGARLNTPRCENLMDERSSEYPNDTKGWVHGANEDACKRPGFDYSKDRIKRNRG